MTEQSSKSAGVGLERPCSGDGREGFRIVAQMPGLELLEARFSGHPYARHRHDTYTICRTTAGLQGFTYRGAHRYSRSGQVVVLHPDEMHDGHAATEAGFAYQSIYAEPALIAEAADAVTGKPGPLPFAGEAVSDSRRISSALATAFRGDGLPLDPDALVLALAEGLLELDRSRPPLPARAALDLPALDRARGVLDAEFARAIPSSELEAVTGLSRFVLARQFRTRYGTSPHRYQVMRRLGFARRRVLEGTALAAAAVEAGFADQAHFSRWFRAAYGMAPAQFRRLQAGCFAYVR